MLTKPRFIIVGLFYWIKLMVLIEFCVNVAL
jgi:hypothetical protein